jgi:hypothetical protein
MVSRNGKNRSGSVAAEALGLAERLGGILAACDFSGYDPYDALRSPILHRLALTPTLRQAAIQSVKRFPVNLRPLLLVTPTAHTKGLALCVSAFVTLGKLVPEGPWSVLAVELAERLLARKIAIRDGFGWGYDFDVQTRWGYYPRTEPNAVVTAFVIEALADVAAASGREDLAAAAEAGTKFACSGLATPAGDELFFSYFRGSQAPIHNANLLLVRAVTRCSQTDGRLPETAERALSYTLARQREDGSWPYGEAPSLSWVDGYHTAYILDCLGFRDGTLASSRVQAALSRGLDLYLQRLIDSDGAPRASLESRYPLDIHAAASAITTLCRLRALDDRALPTAERVFRWAVDHLLRADGRFAFQQHSHWRNRLPFVRWGDAHMLVALAELAATGGTDV